jgi:hypothetical protein
VHFQALATVVLNLLLLHAVQASVDVKSRQLISLHVDILINKHTTLSPKSQGSSVRRLNPVPVGAEGSGLSLVVCKSNSTRASEC